MQSALQYHFEAADFLAWEAVQTEKHEYLAGDVFAMGGARREHVVVSLNIATALKQRLRGSPCQAYIADMKLRADQVDAFFYPDVMVSCHPDDRKAEQFLSHPCLIVEVLSETTAAFDRGAKFVAYRSLESLREYVIIDIDGKRVECFRRTPDNEWLLHDYVGEVDCELTSLGFSVPLAEFFEDLE